MAGLRAYEKSPGTSGAQMPGESAVWAARHLVGKGDPNAWREYNRSHGVAQVTAWHRVAGVEIAPVRPTARETGCEGKIAYRDRHTAEKATMRVLDRKSDAAKRERNQALVTYRCPHCHQWHLGRET